MELSVPAMIAESLGDHGTRPAIEENGRVTTHRQLDETADRLAHYLKAVIGGEGSNVCLHLPRSAHLVIAMLACWKAGHAFVPLPVDTPEGRRAHILRETACAAVITAGALADRFRAGEVPTIDLEGEWADTYRQASAGTPAPAAPPPDRPAYILYTSGSTGLPKGVVIEHGSLANYIAFARATYTADPALPVFPLFSSIGFDLTVTSLFTPLTCGGRLIVYPEPEGGVPDLAILQVMEDDRCTVVKLTPSHLSLLRDRDLSRHRLRTLIVGGEQFTATLAREISTLLPTAASVFNEYGPTEATVGCTVYRYDQNEEHSLAIPIGRPIANTVAYVLDEHRQVLPAGEVGELYLGGTCLARGYWAQPQLTADRFLTDPFEEGGRLYRTGDRARWSAEGNLEFLGRADRQIKWRGFRIELEEIEHRLSACPGITESAVQIVGSELIAFYAGAPQTPETDLRELLGRNLPEYSIPGRFIRLERLPLTTSGKVDRGALAELINEESDRPAGPAPQGEIEEVLAELWAEVLGRAGVGRHETFLALGGHSLRAIRLVARINETFRLEVPLAQIFELPTVAEQGAYLEEKLRQLLEEEI